MSEPNDTKPDLEAMRQHGAPTLLEIANEARRQQGVEEARPGDGDGGGSQIKTRELNPNAPGGGGEGDQDKIKHRVQQPGGIGGLGDEESQAKAADELGKRLFPHRFSGKVDDDGKPIPGKTEEPQKPKPKKEEAPPPKKEEKAEPVVKRAAPPAAMTREDVAHITAETTKAVLAQQQAAKDAQSERDSQQKELEVEELGPTDKKRLEVVQFMAQENPEQYKSLPEKYVKFAKDRKEWIKNWRKENPGETFSADNSEYDRWERENSPEFESDSFADDFDDARIGLAAEKRIAKFKEGQEEELQRLRGVAAEASIGDKIVAERERVTKALREEFAPAIEEDISTEQGRKEATERDPIVAPILIEAVDTMSDVIKEIVRIYDTNGAIKVDRNNKSHQFLLKVANDYQDALLRMTPEETKNSRGQTFVSLQEYRKMTPEQQQRHWSINRNEMINFTQAEILKAAEKAREERLVWVESVMKAKGQPFDKDALSSQRKPARTNPDGIDRDGERATIAGREEEEEETPPGSSSSGAAAVFPDDSDDPNVQAAKGIVSRLFKRG